MRRLPEPADSGTVVGLRPRSNVPRQSQMSLDDKHAEQRWKFTPGRLFGFFESQLLLSSLIAAAL